jgi:hypothetical protein
MALFADAVNYGFNGRIDNLDDNNQHPAADHQGPFYSAASQQTGCWNEYDQY